MRIGVDACTWNNRRGFGGFTRELLETVLADDKKMNTCFLLTANLLKATNSPQTLKQLSLKRKSRVVDDPALRNESNRISQSQRFSME